jgi:hypothetical protein
MKELIRIMLFNIYLSGQLRFLGLNNPGRILVTFPLIIVATPDVCRRIQ